MHHSLLVQEIIFEYKPRPLLARVRYLLRNKLVNLVMHFLLENVKNSIFDSLVKVCACALHTYRVIITF